MKMYFQIVLLLGSFCYLQAQTTTTFQEVGSLEKQKLVNKYSCFFKTMEDQNRFFKVGLTTFSNPIFDVIPFDFHGTNINGLELGIEQKIKTGFSLNYNINLNTIRVVNTNGESSSDIKFNILEILSVKNAIEGRWYFSKKKNILKGLSGNNLSGFYIGLKGEIDNWRILTVDSGRTRDELNTSIKGRNINGIITTGWQQQFSKNGYIDFSIFGGKSWQSKDISTFTFDESGALSPLSPRENWFLDYRISLGFAFGSKSNYDPKDCSILQYFDEEKSMLKIDLFNIFQTINTSGIGGKLSTEFEHKLGKSSFSLSLSSEIDYQVGFTTSQASTELSFGSELRYYYNLKKRIRKGKTGNNLSANYFGFYINRSIGEYGEWTNGPVWGMQRRLFKSLYTDFRIGYNDFFGDIADGLDSGEFTGNIKIGFAF